MAACAVCTVCGPSSVLPVVGRSGRYHGRRQGVVLASSSWAGASSGGDNSSAIQVAGCDSSSSSSPASSIFARSSVLYVSSRGLLQAAAGMGCVGRRNVVCEVAVEIGDSHSSGEQNTAKAVQPGTKVRVTVPLTVYHVGKSPNLNIQGLEGEVKEVLGIFKGKAISATLPIKTQFFIDVEGKQVKFFAHLKDDEFEVVE